MLCRSVAGIYHWAAHCIIDIWTNTPSVLNRNMDFESLMVCAILVHAPSLAWDSNTYLRVSGFVSMPILGLWLLFC